MDWSEQAQEMMQAWAATQQKMWSGWLESVQGAGQSPGPELWSKTIDAWEQSVKETLDAQAEWTQKWAEQVQAVEGAPEDVNRLAKDGQEMMDRWNEAQRQLWQQWFDVLRKAASTDVLSSQSSEGQKILQAWQETAGRAMEKQMEWATAWMQGASGGPRSR